MIIDHLFNSVLTESKSGLQVGDPVIITGNVEFRGKTGDVVDIGRNGDFVVVDLYNHGRKSFHSSDVDHNDYAGSDDEQEYQQRVAEDMFGLDPKVKAKIQQIAAEISDIPGYWDWKRDTFTPYGILELEKALDNNKKYVKYALSLTADDDYAYEDVAEGSAQELSIQQLATISDEALDNAYGYGRSAPGNTFGWQANLMSAAYAKKMIDAGVTDIEKISDAIHKGWNVTAQKFVQNPDQFDDTEKLKQAGKLDAKLQQRAKLMKINYANLDNEEQEKDRVVARALLQAMKGQQDVAEGSVQDKLHRRHQELRQKSGLPNPDYYKELRATYDLPDQERYAKAAELKKKYNVKESQRTQCPECGGAAYEDRVLAEKQDACYHKVRSRYKVWPSAYASGALVQCRKKGAANWGNKSK